MSNSCCNMSWQILVVLVKQGFVSRWVNYRNTSTKNEATIKDDSEQLLCNYRQVKIWQDEINYSKRINLGITTHFKEIIFEAAAKQQINCLKTSHLWYT